MKNAVENRLHTLPYRALVPQGWLRGTLQAQMQGITGRLDEVWGSVGEYSDWIGGTDNNWERPPYWLDGLTPLAFLLGDEAGIQKARRWLAWSMNSQRADGDFGPTYRMAGFDESQFWPKYVILKAMICLYEAQPDEEVLAFMLRYMRFCNEKLDEFKPSGWSEARGGDFAYAILWLHRQTGEGFLLELLAKVNAATLDWTGYMQNLPFTKPTGYYYDYQLIFSTSARPSLYNIMRFHESHIVNVAMAVKQPMMRYRETGDETYLQAVYTGLQALYRHHGQAAGVFSGDEHLSGTRPTQGTELCAVVEYLFSLQLLLEATGDGYFADLIERVAYNALPATITKDFRAHQYDQQANQVLVSNAKRDWYNNDDDSNLFGLEPNFGCCLANLHQGWPKLVKNAILADDEGLRAAVYMPVQATATVGGVPVTVREETDYPAKGSVRFSFALPAPRQFRFGLRIPGWCKGYGVLVNGEAQSPPAENGWAMLRRTFADGDVVELRLDMPVRTETGWYANAATVERGPLLYALNIGEDWRPLGGGLPEYPTWEVWPTTPWNYALDLGSPITAEENPGWSGQSVFHKNDVPVVLRAKAVRLPGWGFENNSAGELPPSPVESAAEAEDVELVPYGCTALRVAAFPWRGRAEKEG